MIVDYRHAYLVIAAGIMPSYWFSRAHAVSTLVPDQSMVGSRSSLANRGLVLVLPNDFVNLVYLKINLSGQGGLRSKVFSYRLGINSDNIR